jgi:hypothetical protein
MEKSIRVNAMTSRYLFHYISWSTFSSENEIYDNPFQYKRGINNLQQQDGLLVITHETALLLSVTKIN